MECTAVHFLLFFRITTYGISILGLMLGILSAGWPERSIRLYVWMMEKFNWHVHPINEAMEIRNTCRFGFWLIFLSLTTFTVTFIKF